MTLNQIIKRVQTICEAHEQINTFVYAKADEFFSSDATFPGAFLKEFSDEAGSKGQTLLRGELFFLDRQIQGGAGTTFNKDEVISDMREVAMDVFAILRYQKFDPLWNVLEDFSLEYGSEEHEDYLAGATLGFTIKLNFTTDRCQVPTALNLS